MTFRMVSKLHNEDSEVQVASLKYCMGPEAEEIVKTFGLLEQEEKDFDLILRKFDEYFKPKINVIRMRRMFQRRIQQPNENEEAYLRALYTAAEDCGFGDLKKERIRDQYICGLQDEKLTEKLEHLYMSNRDNFTLDLVTEYTRTYCDIKVGRQQEKDLHKQDSINEVSRENKLSLSRDQRYRRANCGYCGTVHSRGSCPAFGRKCNVCNKLNHFARVCRSARSNKQVQEVTEVPSDHYDVGDGTSVEEEDRFFLGECITTCADNNQ